MDINRKGIFSLFLVVVFSIASSIAFAGPPGMNNKKEDNKGKKTKEKGKPEKITVCHRPPGNPDNEHEITISERAWPAHKKHGDKKGSCGVLDLVREIKQADVTNFSLNKEGNRQFNLTSNTLQFLDNGSVIKEVPISDTTVVVFSSTDTPTVLTRTEKGFGKKYTLYDAVGEIISQGKLPFETYNGILFGKQYFIKTYYGTSSGEIAFLNLTREQGNRVVWQKMNEDYGYLFQFDGGSNFQTILLGEAQPQPVNLYLFNVFTGKPVSKKYKFNRTLYLSDFQLNNESKLSYVIGKAVEQNQEPQYVLAFDKNMNKIADIGPEFQELSAGKIFDKTDTSVFAAGNESIIEKNLTTNEVNHHRFPVDFRTARMRGDDDEGFLFLSGIGSGLDRFENPVRKVLVFDTRRDTFARVLTFPPDQSGYSKPKWGNPHIFVYQDQNLLKLHNPNSIRIYNYDR